MLNSRVTAVAAVVVAAVAGAVPTALATNGDQARTAKDRFDLKGEVYQDFKIEMKNRANRTLRTIKAGTYRIKVEDKSRIHNFRLIGRGVNKATSVARVGETIWTVKLRPGKYTFLCDPHASTMRGSFRVTA